MKSFAKCTVFLTLLILFVSLVSGCTSTVRFSSNSKTQIIEKQKPSTAKKYTSPLPKSEINDLRLKIIEIAEDWLGTNYLWGGESKSGADCSGFVQSVFAEAGINIPRTSRQQYSAALTILKINAKPGDLIFFKSGSTINHVGIYIGNNTMIHSSSTYGVVRQSINDNYYVKRFAGFGRLIKENIVVND